MFWASGVASGWHGWTMSRGPGAKGGPDRQREKEDKVKKREGRGPESPLSMGPRTSSLRHCFEHYFRIIYTILKNDLILLKQIIVWENSEMTLKLRRPSGSLVIYWNIYCLYIISYHILKIFLVWKGGVWGGCTPSRSYIKNLAIFKLNLFDFMHTLQ